MPISSLVALRVRNDVACFDSCVYRGINGVIVTVY